MPQFRVESMAPAGLGQTGFLVLYVGIVIALGTIIGVILERSGAAITMAETVIRLLGQRFPTLTMSIIGLTGSETKACNRCDSMGRRRSAMAAT